MEGKEESLSKKLFLLKIQIFKPLLTPSGISIFQKPQFPVRRKCRKTPGIHNNWNLFLFQLSDIKS